MSCPRAGGPYRYPLACRHARLEGDARADHDHPDRLSGLLIAFSLRVEPTACHHRESESIATT